MLVFILVRQYTNRHYLLQANERVVLPNLIERLLGELPRHQLFECWLGNIVDHLFTSDGGQTYIQRRPTAGVASKTPGSMRS